MPFTIEGFFEYGCAGLNLNFFHGLLYLKKLICMTKQARRRGGSRGSIEPPLEVNNGGLKTQTVDFQSAFSK